MSERALQAALPREHYVEQDSWQRERRQVLQRCWTCVGRPRELGVDRPGRLAAVEVAGESVLLASDDDGRLHALANVCRHRGAQLVPHPPGAPPAACDARAIRCGYHSWTYRLDGALLRAPHTEQVDGFDPAGFGLAPVELATWAGFAFVRLFPPSSPAPDAPSLADELGPVPERVARYPLHRLVSVHREVYDVAANWKVLAENYNECYHCAGVHPELTRLVPSFGRGGGGQDGTVWTGTPGSRTGRALGRSPSPAGRRARRSPGWTRRAAAAQGRAGVPEPAAQPGRRARRRVRAAAAGGGPHPGRCSTCWSSRGRRTTTWSGLCRVLGPGEPPGLGGLRVGAARDVVRRSTGRAGTPRWRTPAWTSAAGCCPGCSPPDERVSRG